MAAKKTSSRTTTTTKRSAKKPASVRFETTQPREFSLQIGTGFSLLTERVGDGAMVVNRVPAGATLELSYWKDLASVQAPIVTITLHARLDGTSLPSSVIANRDTTGRLVRAPARLELSAQATHLEYWFELKTEAGESLWDSNWGHNHWLELTEAMGPTEPAQEPRAEA